MTWLFARLLSVAGDLVIDQNSTTGKQVTPSTAPGKWRLGVVSYLNAKPLIQGLDADSSIEQIFDVPARLPSLLDRGEVDAALVPVVDLFRHGREWQIVSDACLGCDGETLTVRVFSRVRPESVRRLHVDHDSHTSVVLARIIWQELYGQQLDVVPLVESKPADAYEAILLIGDKVVNNSLIEHDIETDLGSAWKSLTSLPFVFAVWAAQRRLDVTELSAKLSRARDAGLESAALIAEDFGPGLGWPVTLAKRYLTARMRFTLGPRQRAGMAKFFEFARRHHLADANRELVFA